MKKLLTILLICALMLTFAAGCKAKEDGDDTPDSTDSPSYDGEPVYAVINVRDFGEMVVELRPEWAPKAVANFIKNVSDGFYNGRNFHRVISGFMIQGGSYDRQGGGDPDAAGIKTELHPDAKHYYGAFCLAANSAGEGSDSFYIVNSKTSDAEEVLNYYAEELEYILDDEAELRAMYGDEIIDNAVTELSGLISGFTPEVLEKYHEVGGAPHLDGNYTVFGFTISGFEVIDAISAVEVELGGDGAMSKPLEEIIIESVIIRDTP